MNIICEYCGKKIKDNENCQHCGAPFQVRLEQDNTLNDLILVGESYVNGRKIEYYEKHICSDRENTFGKWIRDIEDMEFDKSESW